jgi:hypothetical protein
MGIALFNEEKEDKYSFIKMVTSDGETRQIYLLAISASQLTKWQISMGLHSQPTFVDSVLQSVKENTLKQVDSMLTASRLNMEKLREQQRVETFKMANAHKRSEEERSLQSSVSMSRQYDIDKKQDLKR